MRILVTRPEPDAEETAARLRALGHEAIVAPLTRIVFTGAPALTETPDAVVATSRNGVRAMAGWPMLQALRGRPLFAVGAATAAEARQIGFEAVRTGDGDAAALARLVAESLPQGSAILYVAGRERTGDLDQALAAAGMRVSLGEAYRAEMVERLPHATAIALRAGALDGVLIHSRRGAEVFRSLVETAGLADRLQSVTAYAISSRAAEPLAGSGLAGIAVAGRPDEASLLGLLSGGGWSGRQSPV